MPSKKPVNQRPQHATIPGAEEFRRLASTHTLVPVYRTVAADLETPVSAFLRLAAHEPEAFLLESVEGGEHVGRYTFMGVRPYRRIIAQGGEVTVQEGGRSVTRQADIFDELKRALQGETPAVMPGLPPFTGGAVGFFAYDVVRRIEHLPATAPDELQVPDATLMFFDEVLAFDHVKKAIHVVVTAGARGTRLSESGASAAYADACRRLDRIEALLAAPVRRPPQTFAPEPLHLTPRTPPQQYIRAVERVKEYISAGDVFQCVLSQRFDCEPGVDAFEVYRSLRIVNPSPYMYFLRFPKQGTGNREQGSGIRDQGSEIREQGASRGGQEAGQGSREREPQLDAGPRPAPSAPSLLPAACLCHIVGSSPELLVRVNDGRVEYRPIAGTRPRGVDEVEDRQLEAELRADAKEVAEHIMLVDLGRNDVGRVSEFGSVAVKDLMFVERYSHVMHLVSRIEGQLRPGLGAMDAFRACFPAGTLSGAPKIRAMEIIEELEPARRGVYGGSVLYADFAGNLDSCIAIRTLYMDGPNGFIQAGAGVVADSVPQKEHDECRNKAQAVVRAIERARGA